MHLTRHEFEVLQALALCAGHVVTRERLYEHVWHHPMHPRERSDQARRLPGLPLHSPLAHTEADYIDKCK